MRRILLGVSVLSFIFFAFSCAKTGKTPGTNTATETNKIEQKDDGTIDLNIEKASRYNDNANPSCNTAEWNIVVSKPGRYKVWLSSATVDTMDLQYSSTVKISLLDERLDVQPVGDKIILNSTDVKYPYYRADSYMGTFYIQEAGEYSLQVISDKVLPQSDNYQVESSNDHTKLMSVFLTPVTR